MEECNDYYAGIVLFTSNVLTNFGNKLKGSQMFLDGHFKTFKSKIFLEVGYILVNP